MFFFVLPGNQKFQLKESLDDLKNKIGNLKVELREEMLRADSKSEVRTLKLLYHCITQVFVGITNISFIETRSMYQVVVI